jgi:hypothetical protein
LLGCGSALELADVARLKLTVLTGRDVKLDSSVLIEGLEALGLDLRIVNEQVVPILARYEAISFVLIEPLYFTFSHVLPFFLPQYQEANLDDAVYNRCPTPRPTGLSLDPMEKFTILLPNKFQNFKEMHTNYQIRAFWAFWLRKNGLRGLVGREG